MDTKMNFALLAISVVAITTAFFMGWWRGRLSIQEIYYGLGFEKGVVATQVPCKRCEHEGMCAFGHKEGFKSSVEMYCYDHCPACGSKPMPDDVERWAAAKESKS